MRNRFSLIPYILLMMSVAVGMVQAQDAFTKARAQARQELKEHWKKIAKASSVSVKMENADSREIYKKLGEESGNPIDIRGYHPSRSLTEKKLVSFDVADKGFWEAIERLEEQAPVRFFAGSTLGQGAIRLRTAPRSKMVVFPGAARLRMNSFEMQRRSVLNFAEGSGVAAKLEQVVGLSFVVDVEPRIWVCGVRIKLKKAVDETGRDLLEKVLAPRKWKSGLLDRGTCIGEVRRAYTGSPAPTARKLAIIEGELELKLAPIIPPMKIKDTSQTGQTFDLVGGKAELVESKLTDKGRTKEFTVGFKLSEGLAFGPTRGSTLAPILHCTDGSKLRPLRSTYGNPQLFSFSLHGQQRPDFLEIHNPVGAREIELPFSFQDVPLPRRSVRNQAEGDAAPKGTLPLSELPGSTVSLQLKNVSPEEIAAQLSKQSGNKVRILKGRSAPVAMSLEADKISFWAAMDKLGTLTDVTHVGKREASVWAAATPPTYPAGTVQTLGPLRAAVREMQILVDSRADYAKGIEEGTENYRLKVYADVLMEPKLNVVRQGMSLESCVIGELEMLPAAKPFAGLPMVDDVRGAHLVSATRGYRTGALGNLLLRIVPMSQTVDQLRFFYFVETCEKWQDVTLSAMGEKRVAIDPEVTLDWGGATKNGEYVFILERRRGAGRLRPGFLSDEGRCIAVTKAGDRVKAKNLRFKPVENEPEAMMCWVSFAQKLTAEDKVILKLPAGLKTHAGYLDFKEVPLPQLKTE